MKKICSSLVLVAGMACLGEVSAESAPKAFNVEIDTRFVETGRAALETAGYFDTNRVDAAVLQERLMAHQDAKLLESVRVITHSGENAVDKHVVEYIYPTDYTVRLSTNAVAATNAEAALSAVVEPKSFTMREVGPIVDVTPTLTDDGKLIDLSFRAQLVGEPEWKKYGAKAKREGTATCDLQMEQPLFPVRASVDTKISMRPGTTYVFGGSANRRKGDEDKFVLVFVTPRLIEP